jgi:hypothetical protein
MLCPISEMRINERGGFGGNLAFRPGFGRLKNFQNFVADRDRQIGPDRPFAKHIKASHRRKQFCQLNLVKHVEQSQAVLRKRRVFDS